MYWGTRGFPVLYCLLEFCSNSCPLSWWCYLTISSSVTLFSFCLLSFLVSEYFPMIRLFASGGQNIGASALASVIPVNIQSLFPLGLTSLIALQSKGLSRVFSSTTVRKHQFFSTQFDLLLPKLLYIPQDPIQYHLFYEDFRSLFLDMWDTELVTVIDSQTIQLKLAKVYYEAPSCCQTPVLGSKSCDTLHEGAVIVTCKVLWKSGWFELGIGDGGSCKARKRGRWALSFSIEPKPLDNELWLISIPILNAKVTLYPSCALPKT